jgi:signal transduction histidine kinase
MLRSLFEKLRPASRHGSRPDHASILVPFLIISAGLGVLAWRSYQLSTRMEKGANMLAEQYAAYAADITARRVDSAVQAELTAAADSWQQIEKRTNPPTSEAVQEWMRRNDWVLSGFYVPDLDPASSIYVNEIPPPGAKRKPVRREFNTPTGMMQYTFDPDLLLARVRPAMRQPPIQRVTRDSLTIQQPADVVVVRDARSQGRLKIEDGCAFISPLGGPLTDYGLKASVRTSYVGSGWENQRVISSWLSLIALFLTGLGAYLAARGLKKEAETTMLRGALIANVSHELRTPLSMIRLGAETLQRGAKLKEKERNEIEESILREVLHLSHLVENVLDVARMQHRQTKAVALMPVYPRDLVTTLVSTYESWIRSKGFQVALSIDESIDEQLWDREAVSRALLNLIDNAIKYSGEDRSIEVVLRQTAEQVIIEVRDRGIGIETKDAARIFEPYFRAQFSDTQTRRGAGLGLTLVQQILQAHGGSVEVESAPGVGSTFRLIFPRLGAEEQQAMAGLARTREAY